MPRIQGLESCRKWQRTFFYVKNPDSPDNVDLLNLPIFNIATPSEQFNWSLNPKDMNLDINQIHKIVEELVGAGLTSDDLLRTFISHRVSPLQDRVHKICT